MRLSWVFVIFLLLLVSVFSVQNAEPISVRFLPWEFEMSSALVIQLAAILGALVGLTVGSLSRRSPRDASPREPAISKPAATPVQEPAQPAVTELENFPGSAPEKSRGQGSLP